MCVCTCVCVCGGGGGGGMGEGDLRPPSPVICKSHAAVLFMFSG